MFFSPVVNRPVLYRAMSIKLVHVTTVPLTIKHFLRDQIAYMRRRGLEVVLVSSPDPILDALAAEDALETFRVPMERPISPLRDLLSLFRLVRVFRRLRPTIVHGSTAKAAVLSMLAATVARVPVRFYTVRGLMVETREGTTGLVLRLVEWVTCLAADRVIPVSKSVAAVLSTEGLCSAHKMRLLGHGSSNGVDAETRFSPDRVNEPESANLLQSLGIARNARVVGFVGRIVRDKGVEDLVQAWKQAAISQNVILLVIGEGEPQDPISDACQHILSTDDRIITVPWVNHEEIYLYYHIMDFLVLPSRREGFPNAVLEAAAMERPTIATRATGCVDAVKHGVTGLLVPPRDSEALAHALETYLANPALCKQHGQAARQRVLRDFRQSLIWEALYHEYVAQAQEKGIMKLAATVAAPPVHVGKGDPP